MQAMNRSYIAHIVADKPNGPRGDKDLSPKLAKDISNLMLMCDAHHRLIDHEQVTEHPRERLQQMKRTHEDRITLATGIHPEKKTDILLYGANIGDHTSPVTYEKAITALFPARYPASERGIDLGMNNSSFRDIAPDFWRIEEQNLRQLFGERVRQRLASLSIPHLSVFAIAPQPLLMLLGYLLSDIPAAEVYQLHREPADWRWQDHPQGFAYEIQRPTTIAGPPALVLSLSATISAERVQNAMQGPCTLWTITIPQPNNDFLKSREQLQQFRELIRPLLDEIRLRHGDSLPLHVFPAVPVAVAVEVGRCIMPKAHLPMRVYDQNHKTNGFAFALQIPSPVTKRTNA